ncbi:hypothetical protein ARMSODRAFT_1005150 [Armillaria solidipes]|uniref:IRG-type G domain-containing protein n=1 Tax=Armillaria solidipes TaxID=1076256 RepID=A0A2H3BSY9_9AGAR|nr:hypothetical protein ARMSODRAFT_1005150 [Armillaria solidipes]
MTSAQFSTVILSIPSAIRKEREAARMATQMADEMKEQIRRKTEEIRRIVDAQKELEAKWKKEIHPVEWPSREQYEANKRRFHKEGRFHRHYWVIRKRQVFLGELDPRWSRSVFTRKASMKRERKNSHRAGMFGASSSEATISFPFTPPILPNSVNKPLEVPKICQDHYCDNAPFDDIFKFARCVTVHQIMNATSVRATSSEIPQDGNFGCTSHTLQTLLCHHVQVPAFQGRAWGFASTLAVAAIPAVLGLIRGNKVKKSPTLDLMEERFRNEREESNRRIQQIQNEVNQARGYIEQLQREKREQADLANRARLEAEGIQQLQNEANQAHIEQLRKENQEQADITSRAKLDAEKAAKIVGELQDQTKQKDEEVKNIQAARDEMEAKWKKGIRPVEWPSQEQYEKVKQQYYKEGKFISLSLESLEPASIWDGEEKVAATDVVESTSIVTAYPDPNPSNPFLWFDVPGSGTLSCSDWTYFNNQGLFIFDAIIVLFNDRFTATDAAILKNAERYNIPTYIVRSKSDIHVENLVQKTRRVPGARRDPAKVLDDTRKEYITKTRDSVRTTNLMKNDPPLRSQMVYAILRGSLTLMIREEPLEDSLVLDEHELWKDILQDAFSRRSEKSYGFWTLRAVFVIVWQVSGITFIRLLIYFVHVVVVVALANGPYSLPATL